MSRMFQVVSIYFNYSVLILCIFLFSVGCTENKCKVSKEICDGFDNNCNGKIDESMGTIICGTGNCKNIIEKCVDGKIQICEPKAAIENEICDNIDNNCDGITDESFGELTCGEGECVTTIQACSEGEKQTCVPIEPDCTNKECGDDNCGGLCGFCENNKICDNNFKCIFVGWESVEISSVSAPDEFSVEIIFNVKPAVESLLNANTYKIDFDTEELNIKDVSFDESSNTLKLNTFKQKLGVKYKFYVNTDNLESSNLHKEFISADTASFWVSDFSDPFGRSQNFIKAIRKGLGTHSVIYIEEGYSPRRIDRTIREFDDNIYPIVTDLFIVPPDIDGNKKIVMLGLNGGNYYGGYFSPINAYTDEFMMSRYGLHSNEMEIIHVNVLGDRFDYRNVVPHEFQHLLYHEQHGLSDTYWAYHDEGLAETAVHAVYGSNRYSTMYYFMDPEGQIGNGLSLPKWEYGIYENYTQSYLFWIYVASRLNGLETLTEIFNFINGSPSEVSLWLQEKLGSNLTNIYLENHIALWANKPEGEFGYNGMLEFDSKDAPTVLPEIDTLSLEPITGVFFKLNESSIEYPETVGENIKYVGINGNLDVDFEAPFDITDGVLLIMNMNMNYQRWWKEHSGPDLPAVEIPGMMKLSNDNDFPKTWLDPPPVHPFYIKEYKNWYKNVVK